jgi:serine/threonine-protein phosphatase PP1 catalytic subunit
MHTEKLVNLPAKGRTIVVTDLHGNLEDFNRYLQIWEDFEAEGENHFILTGDFIHSMNGPDGSVEILESLMPLWEDSENFHLLLGNHEWASLTGISVYKGGFNQTLGFEFILKEKFRDGWMTKLEEYAEFFKKLSLAVKTENKVFISHAGPPHSIKSMDDITNITEAGYTQNEKLEEILWNRYGSYREEDVESFLKAVECNAMIVGHTPVDGVKLIGNQLVVSSSYSSGRKAYIELDLEKEIENAADLLEMVKYI